VNLNDSKRYSSGLSFLVANLTFDISISIEIRWAYQETTSGTDTGVVVMQNALASPLRDTVYVHSIDAQGQETVTRIMHEKSTVEKLADPTI